MAEGDILDPVPAPRIDAASSPRPRKVTCEFCECELGMSGEYKSLSDRAKKIREHDETIEKLESTITLLRAEIATLKVTAQQQAPVSGRSGSGISF